MLIRFRQDVVKVGASVVVLLAGINDSDEELAGIVALLTGKYAVMNFIPFNAGDGLPFQRPSTERARAMARHLHQRGILTKLRQSAGQDVDGGCGQLRARAVAVAGWTCSACGWTTRPGSPRPTPSANA